MHFYSSLTTHAVLPTQWTAILCVHDSDKGTQGVSPGGFSGAKITIDL